jgi:uncharacterized Tic20 family protein
MERSMGFKKQFYQTIFENEKKFKFQSKIVLVVLGLIIILAFNYLAKTDISFLGIDSELVKLIIILVFIPAILFSFLSVVTLIENYKEK